MVSAAGFATEACCVTLGKQAPCPLWASLTLSEPAGGWACYRGANSSLNRTRVSGAGGGQTDLCWTLTEGQRRPKAEAGPHPQPPCPATLTRRASSPPATGTTSRGRCHSPGPRLPAAAPAWPPLLAASARPPRGRVLGGSSGRETLGAAAAPSIRRRLGSAPRPRLAARRPWEPAPANGAAASGADARMRERRRGGVRAACGARPGSPGARAGVRALSGLSWGVGPGAERGRAFPGRGRRAGSSRLSWGVGPGRGACSAGLS